MDANVPAYFRYWGKAKKEPGLQGADYHLLPYHCLDVAAVGQLLLSAERPLARDLADFLEVEPQQLKALFVFFLALHDLGKFASAFQALYQPEGTPLYRIQRCKPYDGKDYRHDRLGVYFWECIERDKYCSLISLDGSNSELLKDGLRVLMNVVLGHHGSPINVRASRSIKGFTETDNLQAASQFFQDVWQLIQPEFPLDKLLSKEWCDRLKQVSWQLAGLAVLADWIGSDNSHFHFYSDVMSLDDYWAIAQKTANRALAATDLNNTPAIQPFVSVKHHYGFEPTPLQRWAETIEVDASPQLFLLEDVTGAGKTEAALVLTHRLMAVGAADGFYFGLPTMATSNAMFKRIAQHYLQMLGAEEAKPSIVLAHGAREMNDLFREAVLSAENPDSQYDATDATATAQCNQWLVDSRKKALLAPVGVGTIDQALLAVLPRKHQSLRLLGLNRKVLIFDEVHAADEFMFELLESLLKMHFHQGGSVVLLTATLSYKQRSHLVAAWQNAAGLTPLLPANRQFPLATKVSSIKVSSDTDHLLSEQALQSRADVSRKVNVGFCHTFDQCVKQVLRAVAQGRCVVWIRNSVDDALQAFQAVQPEMENPDDCLLFHSRFVLHDRKQIEEKVLAVLGKASTVAERAGKVLIATQVFQESLDADADLMISDICPIDDLIQRAGRLHRHTRDAGGSYQQGIQDQRPEPLLMVHAPEWQEQPKSDWLSKHFRNTQYVYRSPARLWLGMRELRTLGCIQMPDNARQLIEAVYSDEAYEQVPPALQYQEDTLIGDERSKAAKAKSQLIDWQYGYCDRSADAWYDYDSDISTRYSDIETVEVLVLRRDENGQLQPLVDDPQFVVQLSTVKLSKNKYADKLQRLPEQEEEMFKARYRKAKYLQCWLPERDTQFTYHSTTGFVEKQ